MIVTNGWRGGLRRRAALCATCGFGLVGVLVAASAVAEPWPEIPASERAMTSVEEFPGSPAVVLLEKGRMVFDPQGVSSYLEVYSRVKVLTQEGVEYGSISLPSSDFFRMKDLEGRTHTPDGRVVELPKDSVFSKKHSTYYNRTVTSFAMPEVVPGAIVEYRYRAYFDSVVFSKPWYFQGELPALRSTITYVIPPGFRFTYDTRKTLAYLDLKTEDHQGPSGIEATFTVDMLPAIPDEPSRFPFEDLSTRVVFLPLEYHGGDVWFALLESWESTISIMQGRGQWGYKHFRNRSGGAERKAKELVAGGGDPRQKVCTLYRFVRDQIVTEEWTGLSVGERTGDEVLKNGRGDYPEKAALLQVMLEAAKIDTSLAWANPVDEGRVNPKVPNPGQFDRLLVAAEIGGGRLFLDPCDRRLACGALPPELEGVPALLVDGKKPEWVMTPLTPPAESRRVAKLDLAVDERGKVAGTGSLTLSGHHALGRLDWRETREETVKAWKEWLEGRLPGFEISATDVTEDREARRVEVKWNQAQREEEVLGDEVAVSPAAPLALDENPFTLPAEARSTPILLGWADTDQVDLHLRWAEGWIIDSRPQLRAKESAAGALKTSLSVDEATRTLDASRVLELGKRELMGNAEYDALKALYAAAAANDTESIILAARTGS